MQENFTILMAQINPIVGDLAFNTKKIIDIIKAYQKQVDIILFPELALTGYPPEDLVLRKEFHEAVHVGLDKVKKIVEDCHVFLGHPTLDGVHCHNSLSIIYRGETIKIYHKQKLPNYEVFDEHRYFVPGKRTPCVVEIKNHQVGVCICEDLWQPGPMEDLIAEKVSLILIPNASPFDITKHMRREKLLKSYAKQGPAIVYVNQMSGQDEILFDGQSIAVDKKGEVCARSLAFEEDLRIVQLTSKQELLAEVTPLLSTEALMYKALIRGLKDYVQKNHFPGVLLGLSGGIDSALTLAIAVDALGPEKVHALILPSRYSAEMSHDDALQQLKTLKVSYSCMSIEPIFEAALTTLAPEFKDKKVDITEENIQARIRCMLLMALSNKTGKMVLSTSNKSETAVGYSTLYGDMAGGLAILKDVLKTEVYALARYRNSLAQVIPERVITRAPSAELRENQRDQDSLPDYKILDEIIKAYVVEDLCPQEIIQLGFSTEIVHQVIQLIKGNEYKRRQGPPGIKISPIAFGKDWRYPITNGFK